MVLLCGPQNVNEIREIAQVLLVDSVDTELLEVGRNVERRLTQVLQDDEHPALVIVCVQLGKPDLDSEALHRIFESARRVDDGWSVCEFDPGQALSILPIVRNHRRALQRRLAKAHSERWESACQESLAAARIEQGLPQERSTDPTAALPVALPVAQCANKTRAHLPFVAAALAMTVLGYLLGTQSPQITPGPSHAAPIVAAHPTSVQSQIEPKGSTTGTTVIEARTSSRYDVPTEGPFAPEAPSVIEARPNPGMLPELAAQGPQTPLSPAGTVDRRPVDPLREAIAHGHVKIVNGLAVSRVVAGDRDWRRAMTLCKARAFWKSTGWRTPSRKQLAALSRARLLDPGTYWSSTRVDVQGLSAMMFDTSNARSVAHDKHHQASHTVCIHAAPGAVSP